MAKPLTDSSGSVGQIGPPGTKDRARFDIVIKDGQQFRMLDENGELRYSGWLHGEYTGLEPLEEYGREKGCVRIELEHDGAWIPVENPNTSN